MSNDAIATLLVNGLPYAWGVKAVVFAVLSITLVLQRPQSRLGVVIDALFIATLLTSLWTSWLLTYLTQDIDGTWANSSQRWSLLVLGNLLPWIVNAFGIAVTYYTYKAEPLETKDERDKRQDAQQTVLDETSLVLAKRGKTLSDAGVVLDERRVQLGEDRRDMEQREHDQAVRDEEGG